MHTLFRPAPPEVSYPDRRDFVALQSQLDRIGRQLRRVETQPGRVAFTVVGRRATWLIATLPEVRAYARNLGAA